MNPTQLATALELVDDIDNDISTFLQEVSEGLNQAVKTLPCKYFYDERGSQLFEKICLLDEYYITRTETLMLQQYAEQIAALIGEGAIVIEPGSGAGKKVQQLLDTLHAPSAYIPIEISAEILQHSSDIIQAKYPNISVYPVSSDFTASLESFSAAINTDELGHGKENKPQVGSNRCLFFPGSTIGNFSPPEAIALLKQFSQMVGSEGSILIGVDRLKSLDIIKAAYNDSQGVTAQFNKNILRRINDELGADFVLADFSHQAIFNEAESRIEMHLVSEKKQTVTLAKQQLEFGYKESIHTENSYKYSDQNFQKIVSESGLSVKQHWLDPQQLFSLYLLVPKKAIPKK